MNTKEKGLLMAEIAAAAVFLTGEMDAPKIDFSSPQHTQILAQRSAPAVFAETENFSKDFFEKVRASTFILELREEDYIGRATAWLAKIEGDSYYFITAGHVVDALIASSAELWRPGIDQYRLASSEVKIARKGSFFSSNSYDVAVVKINVKNNPLENLSPLDWQDDIFPKADEEVLVAGYPLSFSRLGRQELIPFGFPIKVEGTHSIKNKSWKAEGSLYPGNSGSPVVVNREGKPVVIGVISEGSIEIDPTDTKRFISPSTLNLQELMARIGK